MTKIWVFFIILLLMLYPVYALPPGGTAETTYTDGYNSEYKFYSDGRIEPGGKVPSDYFGKITPTDAGEFEIDGRKYTLNKGDSIIRNNDGSANVIRAEKVTTKDESGEETIIEEAEDGRINKDGSFEFKRVKNLRKGSTTIVNGQGVKFKNGILTAEKADSFINDKSVTININKLESVGDIYSVESADSFLSDCIRVDNIKDSEFKITNKVEITTKSNVNLKITDCSYNEVEFSGKGKITIDKSSDNPTYTLENGSLTKKENNYNETVQSETSTIIETDKTFGFKCLTISPVGSYFYNDKDLRKDFVINVPKESSTYKLCLRKNIAQQFKDYNGLVDFVGKKIELNGIVNYLRYPLKNNQISSLLSSFVYRGLKDVKTLLTYDKNLIFLSNIEIKNILKNKQQITITKPNNFYSIEEIELGDGKIHRVVDISLISKEDATQNILSNYESDSLDADVNINDNILVQQIGESKVTILPPEHPKINSFLR